MANWVKNFLVVLAVGASILTSNPANADVLDGFRDRPSIARFLHKENTIEQKVENEPDFKDTLGIKLEKNMYFTDNDRLNAIDNNLYLGYFWNDVSKHKNKGKATHIGIFYVDKNNNLRLFHSASNGSIDIQHLDYVQLRNDSDGIERYMLVRKNKDGDERVLERYHFTGIVKEDIDSTNVVHFLTLMKDAEKNGYPSQRRTRIKDGRKRKLNGNCAYTAFFYPIALYDKSLKQVFKKEHIKFVRDYNWASGKDVWLQYSDYENCKKMVYHSERNNSPNSVFKEIFDNYALNKRLFAGSDIYKYLAEKKKWKLDPITVATTKID